jgi:hypothetical protein
MHHFVGAVGHDRQQVLANAAALGNALLAFLVVPWSICLLLYSGLHWTYPADKAAALRNQLHAMRERSHPLEEEGVLEDRQLASSSGSPLSDGSTASIELLRRPGEAHAAGEDGRGGEEARLQDRGGG